MITEDGEELVEVVDDPDYQPPGPTVVINGVPCTPAQVGTLLEGMKLCGRYRFDLHPHLRTLLTLCNKEPRR